MARPRIFISSTFFDLRQVRADLERFIKDLGYDTVRNESGNIPYGRSEKLEEYCYKEISEVDILVGIVGGRFGSTSDASDYSITQTEIKTAISQDKQAYIFIEKNVLSEYNTYLINKENESIKYRYADDVRIYKFIEEVYSLPKNNIVHGFETALDITTFLREQWAGLFRDLLTQQARKGQFENVSQKVNELNEVAGTLKTYLENVITSVSEKKSAESIITGEKKRLENFSIKQNMRSLGYIDHLEKAHDFSITQIISILKESNSITDLHKNLIKSSTGSSNFSCVYQTNSISDINNARKLLNLKEYTLTTEELSKIREPDYKRISRARDVIKSSMKKSKDNSTLSDKADKDDKESE